MAIDYRLRYYFAVTPSRKLIAWDGAHMIDEITYDLSAKERGLPLGHGIPSDAIEDFFSSLDTHVEKNNPVSARLSNGDEEALNRYCVVLALFDQVYRSGIKLDSLLFSPELDYSTGSLLGIAEPHWIEDLCRLSRLFYETQRTLIDPNALLNPVFTGSSDVGGADADIIVSRCLIEFKATVNPKIDAFLLYQLLGYTFLDYDDQFQIDSVGVYLARQGILIRWPLRELLQTLSGGAPVSLPDVRLEFRALARRGHARNCGKAIAYRSS